MQSLIDRIDTLERAMAALLKMSDLPASERAELLHELKKDSKEARDVKRGTRLPLDWQPTEDGRDFAHNLGHDPDVILAGFRDFWIAKPGAGGRKLDWDATWRNWCRNEKKPTVGFQSRPNGRSSEIGAFARAITRLGGKNDLP